MTASWYGLLAFSRRQALLARLGSTLAGRLQHRFVQQWLQAMLRAVADG